MVNGLLAAAAFAAVWASLPLISWFLARFGSCDTEAASAVRRMSFEDAVGTAGKVFLWVFVPCAVVVVLAAVRS